MSYGPFSTYCADGFIWSFDEKQWVGVCVHSSRGFTQFLVSDRHRLIYVYFHLNYTIYRRLQSRRLFHVMPFSFYLVTSLAGTHAVSNI